MVRKNLHFDQRLILYFFLLFESYLLRYLSEPLLKLQFFHHFLKIYLEFSSFYYINLPFFVALKMIGCVKKQYFPHFLKIYVEFSSFYYVNLPPFQLAVFLLSLLLKSL